MTDVHSHILFDIDDGSKDIDTSIKMLKTEFSDGVTDIIATPHFDFAVDNVFEFIAKRNERIDALKITFPDIKIHGAAEVVASPFLANAEHLDMLCIENTRMILLEMPSGYFGNWIDSLVEGIRNRNITPIFVHIERYPYLSSVKNAERLVKKGALMQVNSEIVQNPNFFTKIFLKRAAKKNLIHFIGTDAHSDEWRKPNLKKGYAAANELFGRAYTRKIAKNGDSIVTVGHI